jgi:glycosyltransferase involved in cell wall biosynthesis
VIAGLKVAVVVPARDEQELVGETVRGIPRFVDDVVLVDDGSCDSTAPRARAARPDVFVVTHPEPRGVGAAIVAGYRVAAARGAGVIAVMAGDGQMCPDDLLTVLDPIVRGRADYVKGERLSHPDVDRTMPPARHAAGYVLGRLTSLAVGVPGLTDSQCGYTAIRASALRRIGLDRVWPGYGYPNDLVARVVRAGLRVAQVPVRPVYRGEKSGVRPWHVAVIVGLIARAAAARWLAPAAQTPASHSGAPARPTVT